MIKEKEKPDLVYEEKTIVKNFIGSNSLQDDGKIFDLIDMNFIRVQKYFAPKELIDSMKILYDCGSGYFELFGDDNYGKKVIYDFLFLDTYIGGKYGDSSNEWNCISEYFNQGKIAEKLFA